MKKLFTLGAAVAIAAVLAACGGGSEGGTATASGGEGGASSGESTVSVANVGGAGTVLVDSSGRALYASEQETAAGKALCTGACTQFWKPLTVSGGMPEGGAGVGHLGVIKRPDGTRQVTDEGMLLYTFTQEGPEEVTGDGFEDEFEGRQFTWHVVGAGGGEANAGSTETSESGGGRTYGY